MMRVAVVVVVMTMGQQEEEAVVKAKLGDRKWRYEKGGHCISTYHV